MVQTVPAFTPALGEPAPITLRVPYGARIVRTERRDLFYIQNLVAALEAP